MGLLNDIADTEAADLLFLDWEEDFYYETSHGPQTFQGAFAVGASALAEMTPGDQAMDKATLWRREGTWTMVVDQLVTRAKDGSVWMIQDVPPAEHGMVEMPVVNARLNSLGKM